MSDKEKCCGTCRYHVKDKNDPDGKDFICVNTDSYCCTCCTEYKDGCVDLEGRE